MANLPSALIIISVAEPINPISKPNIFIQLEGWPKKSSPMMKVMAGVSALSTPAMELLMYICALANKKEGTKTPNMAEANRYLRRSRGTMKTCRMPQ